MAYKQIKYVMLNQQISKTVSTVPALVLEILHFEYWQLARQNLEIFEIERKKKIHRSSGIRIHDHSTPAQALACSANPAHHCWMLFFFLA